MKTQAIVIGTLRAIAKEMQKEKPDNLPKNKLVAPATKLLLDKLGSEHYPERVDLLLDRMTKTLFGINAEELDVASGKRNYIDLETVQETQTSLSPELAELFSKIIEYLHFDEIAPGNYDEKDRQRVKREFVSLFTNCNLAIFSDAEREILAENLLKIITVSKERKD